MITLRYHGSNTPDGEHKAYCWEYLKEVDYGKGRIRELVLFAVVKSKDELRMDENNQPMMCVCVCNSTKGISGKAKINKLKRALLTKKHGLSLMQSYKTLPDMSEFMEGKADPYSIKVENKIVNGKRVSNITHVYSELAKSFVDIRGVFDTAK